MTLRFAIIGCGRIAPKHVENLMAGNIKNAKLAAVCDIQGERARKLGERYKIPWFANMHEMMEEMANDIDIISILTPSGDHAKHTLELAKYGKHIVVEKPMALTLSDADDMIRACDQNGIKLFVVKQNRFNLPVIKLRHELDLGRFGKLVMGTVRIRWCRDQKYYDQDSWRGTWERDGGVFANQAIHHIDLLQWMMGDVESVFAKSATRLVNIEVEDTGIVLVKFVNGALGVIEATTATRPVDLEGSISILGEKGAVEIAGFAVNEIRHWKFSDTNIEEKEVQGSYKQNPPDVYGFGHVAYLNNVTSSVLDGKSALVDGLEGRKSLEIVSAIYESIETGKEVTVKFVPKKCRLGIKGAPDDT